ncbi:MAG: hypothetical protein IPO81_18545 [Kouleothrix sp.]|nr:hypothetical protein [Kouleothrix sp.]
MAVAPPGVLLGLLVGVRVAVRVGVAVGPPGVLVGVCVGVLVGPAGVLVGVAVGVPPPEGSGIAALSSRRSSNVAATAFPLVAPSTSLVAWLVKLWLELPANAAPNAASPLAR